MNDMARELEFDACPPLVTFALLSYNQEPFIAEAVKAALGQTYQPLEIIISDDGSNDRSADIIRAAVNNYSGPHTITVNVNSHNLGIGMHVNALARMARGRILVLAGGDDISMPERTSKMVDVWKSTHPRPSAVFCGARIVSEAGIPFGEADPEIASGDRRPEHLILFKAMNKTLVLGACGAYDLNLFQQFGDLDPDLSIEDIPLSIRASMANGISYLRENLVDYRRNVSVWKPSKIAGETLGQRKLRRKSYTHARLVAARQVLKDAVSTGNPSFINAATRAYALHEYVHNTCVSGRLSIWRYLSTSAYSEHWRYPLATTLVDVFPRVYSMLLMIHRSILRLIRN